MKIFDNIALEQNNINLDNIEIYLPSIVQEGMVDDLIERLASVLTPIKDIFNRFTIEHTADEDKVLTETLDNIKRYIHILKKSDEKYIVTKVMSEVDKTIIGVPNGFNSKLHKFVPDLLSSSEDIQKYSIAELEKFNTLLSNFITNKESRKNAKPFTSEIKAIKKSNDTILSNINDHFKYTSKDSGGTYIKNVIDGYRDLLKLEDPVFKLAKVNAFKNVSYAQTSVQKTVDLLDMFLKELNTEKAIDAEYIKSLAMYTRELARLFETVSMVRLYSEFTVRMYGNILSTVVNKL